ncbi:MAG: ABC transporter ATP-binding protein [Halobacteriota archaeon]|nr:ABC transporter ATP-binding protein [Halobacteriota archaeon]
MLQIEDLSVDVEGRRIIEGLHLIVEEGETHVLLGPNGSGKSSLLLTVLGYPKYKVKSGSILFKGKDITHMPTTDRIKLGIGISFQSPPAVRGVRLSDMVNVAFGKKTEEAVTSDVVELAKNLKFTNDFLERDVNLGFSGGEVKRSEIMQLVAQNPDFVMFDEPDSGVDVENVELIGGVMSELLDRDKRPSERQKSGLIITHLGFIMNYVKVDRAHVMLNGKIACSGNSKEIMDEIMKEGYERCVRSCQT